MADREARKAQQRAELASRDAQRRLKKSIRDVLEKAKDERTTEDALLLEANEDQVAQLQQEKRRYRESQERQVERPDSPGTLQQKIEDLAGLLQTASHVVVYTGAGISTAAGIPDYRGPRGIWTQLKQGKSREDLSRPEVAMQDLCPTETHMILANWVRRGVVKHIVSQNCDGLHLRSGVPPSRLSEIHGNCLIEVCPACEAKQAGCGVLWRGFDVTGGTAVRRHATGRSCPRCGAILEDTIVHFGEKNRCHSVHEWPNAFEHAARADMILCLGSSLKILKSYSRLWTATRHSTGTRARLAIVNLQWTPKDAAATLKVQAPVDEVVRRLNDALFPQPSPSAEAECDASEAYCRDTDPFFLQAMPLRDDEQGVNEGRGWFGQGLRPPAGRRHSTFGGGTAAKDDDGAEQPDVPPEAHTPPGASKRRHTATARDAKQQPVVKREAPDSMRF